MSTQEKVQAQRSYFMNGTTKPLAFRLAALEKLERYITENEQALFDALYADLGKLPQESYMSEVGLVLEELRFVKKNLRKWIKPRRAPAPLAHFPATSRIYAQPYGAVLIMSPWNYPFQLTIIPLIGAIAAGNCAMIKPSAYSAATSAFMAKMVGACFDPGHVDIVLGGRQQNQDLLEQRFDYIFFTGGITVGGLVMQAAAKNLTPLTLELGGKSPCIVDGTADLELAARRIAFGKFMNAGQTCVAPDYLIVEKDVCEALLGALGDAVRAFFSDTPLASAELPKIINEKHFDRLLALMEGQNIFFGGKSDRASLKIEPTVLRDVSTSAPVMGEEIFGPVLPVLTYESFDRIQQIINMHKNPLSLYIFSNDKAMQQRLLDRIPFGGGCINDTIIHVASTRIPFGGVGASGLGNYHGHFSFETFSHMKGIIKRGALDLNMRYHPYNEKKMKAIRRVLR